MQSASSVHSNVIITLHCSVHANDCEFKIDPLRVLLQLLQTRHVPSTQSTEKSENAIQFADCNLTRDNIIFGEDNCTESGNLSTMRINSFIGAIHDY